MNLAAVQRVAGQKDAAMQTYRRLLERIPPDHASEIQVVEKAMRQLDAESQSTELAADKQREVESAVDQALAASDPARWHKCDVCSRLFSAGNGYCLVTEEVISSPDYWEKVMQKYPDQARAVAANEPVGDFVLMVVQRLVASPTPWLVCDPCISLFSGDKARAKDYAVQWWRSGKRFSPPGNGPAPPSSIRLPVDKYLWAVNLSNLIQKHLCLEPKGEAGVDSKEARQKLEESGSSPSVESTPRCRRCSAPVGEGVLYCYECRAAMAPLA
jgi:hypothetical protein